MTVRRALLVHGMGSDASWWDPFLQPLRENGVEPVALELPALEQGGAASWCETVLNQMNGEPVILIGHSLGAAVCIRAALAKPVSQLVILALPPFVEGFTPRPPRTSLPAAAVADTARYLRETSAQAGKLTGRFVHILGDNDPAAPLAHARQLPLPVVVVPAAGHQLNRYPAAVAAVVRFICAR